MQWKAYRNLMHQGTSNVSYYDIFVRPNNIAVVDTAIVILNTENNKTRFPGVIGISISSMLFILFTVLGLTLLSFVSVIAIIVFGVIEWSYRNKMSKRPIKSDQINALLEENNIPIANQEDVEFKHGTTKTTLRIKDDVIRIKKKRGKEIENLFVGNKAS